MRRVITIMSLDTVVGGSAERQAAGPSIGDELCSAYTSVASSNVRIAGVLRSSLASRGDWSRQVKKNFGTTAKAYEEQALDLSTFANEICWVGARARAGAGK